ncbi:MAG TPA: lecithin retinol acyltransferase family protein [Burkholderiaceae bacterium]|nr:lecithin retinol acyltransferase family protein [Burkholderiaceae bacterium]
MTLSTTAPRTELPLGAHLVTPRGRYEHHGIYVGNGKVVHYAGFCDSRARSGPVEEVSLMRFAAGREIRVEAHAKAAFPAEQIAARARARIGEDRYHLLTNNCEHFAAWCIEGKNRSTQVRKCLMNPLLGMRVVAALMAALRDGGRGVRGRECAAAC